MVVSLSSCRDFHPATFHQLAWRTRLCASVLDGLACFNAVGVAGCAHSKVITGGGRASVEQPEFHWVKPILGNVKSALRGTYQAIRPKYAQRYLAEFEYRFNRRFDLPGLIPHLAYVAVRTPPLPERRLKAGLA